MKEFQSRDLDGDDMKFLSGGTGILLAVGFVIVGWWICAILSLIVGIGFLVSRYGRSRGDDSSSLVDSDTNVFSFDADSSSCDSGSDSGSCSAGD